ncbi:unnamed protein product, partial [Cyprideis torosa]
MDHIFPVGDWTQIERQVRALLIKESKEEKRLCDYLRNLDILSENPRRVVESFAETQDLSDALPVAEVGCVYLLVNVDDPRAFYIGSTMNLRRRYSQHRTSSKTFGCRLRMDSVRLYCFVTGFQGGGFGVAYSLLNFETEWQSAAGRGGMSRHASELQQIGEDMIVRWNARKRYQELTMVKNDVETEGSEEFIIQTLIPMETRTGEDVVHQTLGHFDATGEDSKLEDWEIEVDKVDWDLDDWFTEVDEVQNITDEDYCSAKSDPRNIQVICDVLIDPNGLIRTRGAEDAEDFCFRSGGPADPDPGRKCSKRSLTLLVTEQRNSIAEPLMATECNRLKSGYRTKTTVKNIGSRRGAEELRKTYCWNKRMASILLKTQHSPRHVLCEGGRGPQLLLMDAAQL